MCPKEDQKEGRVDSKEGKTLSFLEKKRRSSPTQQIGSDKQFYLVCELLFQGFEWKLAFFFLEHVLEMLFVPFLMNLKTTCIRSLFNMIFLDSQQLSSFFFLSLLVCIEARKTWWTIDYILQFGVQWGNELLYSQSTCLLLCCSDPVLLAKWSSCSLIMH